MATTEPTEQDTAWVETALGTLRDSVADLHDFALEVSSVERCDERPAGTGCIHISVRFVCQNATGTTASGALLLPLPAAVTMTGILMMLPEATIAELSQSEDLDSELRHGMLETGSMLVNAIDDAARATNTFVKVRFDDFTTTTAEQPAQEADAEVFDALLRTAWDRAKRPVRLLGLGVGYRSRRAPAEQLPLFGEAPP